MLDLSPLVERRLDVVVDGATGDAKRFEAFCSVAREALCELGGPVRVVIGFSQIYARAFLPQNDS